MNIEQIRQKAQNENTSSEILAELAQIEDSLTRKYVASNPNTPVEILQKLASEFPEEIMANPILDLLILESPQSITAIKMAIAQSPHTPRRIYDVMVDFVSKMRQAQNENTPPKILAQLANKDESIPIRKAVARNSSTSKKTLDYLEKDEWHVLTEVAKNPNTSINALRSLLASPFKDVAHKARRNIKTKIDRIAYLDEMMENNLLNMIEERLRKENN